MINEISEYLINFRTTGSFQVLECFPVWSTPYTAASYRGLPLLSQVPSPSFVFREFLKLLKASFNSLSASGWRTHLSLWWSQGRMELFLLYPKQPVFLMLQRKRFKPSIQGHAWRAGSLVCIWHILWYSLLMSMLTKVLVYHLQDTMLVKGHIC